MLLHCCNLPGGPLCQSPVLTGTSLDGLCFTHSDWLYVLPAVFLHKAPWSHAKICLHSLAWHPGSGRITNHKGQNIPPGTSAVHQDTDHLPWQLSSTRGQAGLSADLPHKQPSSGKDLLHLVETNAAAPDRGKHVWAQERRMRFRRLQRMGWCSESLLPICIANLQFLW